MDEDIAFLQKRLALCGLIGAALCALGELSSLFHRFTNPGEVGWHAHLLQLAGGGILLVGGLVCRGRQRSLRSLRVVEAIVVLTSALCLDLVTLRFPPDTRPDLWATLATLVIIVLRASLVPSTPRRTFALSLAAGVPLLFVAISVQRELPGLAIVSGVVTWHVIGVGVATVTSAVVYGLVRAVRRAMELGQYTLLEKIGEGGMGQVYRARHAMLRRPTAVKLVHPESPEDLARFEREAQLTAQLTHPNTITVFDYGKTPDGVFYYAMELLDGADLQKVVERGGPMPAARVVHVLAQIADALAEAHAVGLIHRDIKPGNVILCPRGNASDVAKVLDFGLVRTTERSDGDRVSSPNTVLGTPLYLSPESIREPDTVDARADVYALGAVGYFLLTGRPVFEATSLVALLRDHMHTEPIPPHERLGKEVPADLEAIVLACLAKSPDDRPASALVLRDRLRACAAYGSWTETDARAAWAATTALAKQPLPNPIAVSTTIAIDLDQRSPNAVTLAP